MSKLSCDVSEVETDPTQIVQGTVANKGYDD